MNEDRQPGENLLIAAVYPGAAMIGLLIVATIEMSGSASLWIEIVVAVFATWAAGFLATKFGLTVGECLQPGSLKVPRKGTEWMFCALWFILIWKLEVNQTTRPTVV